MPGSFAELLGPFRACFTAPPSLPSRPVRRAARPNPGLAPSVACWPGAWLAGTWHRARAHRFFTQARWRPGHLGLLLADLIVGWLLGADQPVLLAVDDTLVRRQAAGCRWPPSTTTHRLGWPAHRLGPRLSWPTSSSAWSPPATPTAPSTWSPTPPTPPQPLALPSQLTLTSRLRCDAALPGPRRPGHRG
jgi:hypothetical protein